MAAHGADPLRPPQYTILTYIQHLQTTLSSSSMVMNNISGARTWVLASDGIASAFDIYLVKLMKPGVQRTSNDVAAQAHLSYQWTLGMPFGTAMS